MNNLFGSNQTTRTLVLLYVITCLHHVIEGFGWVFEFRLKSLITPITFGIPLLITLTLLFLYNKTQQKFILYIFATIAFLWWVLGIGFFDGFYNHTLNVLLWLLYMPTNIMHMIYPTYVPPTDGAVIPCDGVKYSYCSLTIASIFYELAGIASFVFAIVLTVNISHLIKTKQHASSKKMLSHFGVIGVCLGSLAGLGMTPMLTMYMVSGKPMALIVTVILASISIASMTVAVRSIKS